MNKRTLWLAVLAVVSGAWAQDLEQKVSYSGSATTAKQLLETLGKQTGLFLGTTPQTANEVMVVNVKDVPLMDLLRRVASTCAAEWKQEAGGYRLVRPEALAREQAQADLAARAKAFEKPLQRLMESVDKSAAFDAAQAQRMAEDARKMQESLLQGGRVQMRGAPAGSSSRSPAARALIRLLGSLSSGTIASIAPNTRIVFASSPNRMQRALGGKSSSILSTLVQEHNLYARALGDTPRETTPSNNRFTILGGPDLSARPITQLGKALVIFTRGAGKSVSVELKVADPSGAVVARANEFLVPEAAAAPANTNEAGQPMTLSASAKEYATLMAGPAAAPQSDGRQVVRISVAGGPNMTWSSGSTSVPKVSDEWKQKLSQPEKFEPHEFVAGQVLRGVASAEALQLIANLPDDTLIPVCQRLLNARMTPAQFLGYLSVEQDLNIQREDGWMVIAPRHPSEVRDSRVDRAPLGALLRVAVKNGHARLDDMANYALRQPEGLPEGSFDDRTIRLLSPDTGQDFDFNGSDRRAMLKLYGLMGASQRQGLIRGGTIRLGALDPRQATLLHNMVFHSPAGPQVRSPENANSRRPEPQGAVTQQVIAIAQAPGAAQGPMPMFAGSFDSNLSQERTEALPFGVPTDGVLTLRVGQQQGVLGARADGSDARFMSADQLAGDLMASNNPELAAILGSGSGPFTRFRTATLTQFDFHFQFSLTAELSRQLRDAEITIGASTTGFDGLPQNFRNQVQQIQRRMQERTSNIDINGPISLPTRRGSPPPPR